MFAYCRNNPVSRKDASGTEDVRVTDGNDDDNPLNDYYGSGGASGGGSPTANSGGSATKGVGGSSGNVLSGKGFKTFTQLKAEIGSPGTGNQWHHIVEQCQVTKSGFDSKMVNNTNNVVPVSDSTHRSISGYYSSKQPFTDGLTVRNWLAGQSFSVQYAFGIDVLTHFK